MYIKHELIKILGIVSVAYSPILTVIIQQIKELPQINTKLKILTLSFLLNISVGILFVTFFTEFGYKLTLFQSIGYGIFSGIISFTGATITYKNSKAKSLSETENNIKKKKKKDCDNNTSKKEINTTIHGFVGKEGLKFRNYTNTLVKSVIKRNNHLKTNYNGVCIHNNGNTRSIAIDDVTWACKKSTYDKRGYHPSWHYSVDDDEIIRYIPYGYSCYAAGDGVNGSGNANHINIEVCEFDGFRNSYNPQWRKSRENSIKLVAQLLYDHNWTIDKVKQHNNFSSYNKDCPRVIRKEGWAEYLNEIQIELLKIKAKHKIT